MCAFDWNAYRAKQVELTERSKQRIAAVVAAEKGEPTAEQLLAEIALKKCEMCGAWENETRLLFGSGMPARCCVDVYQCEMRQSQNLPKAS